jgi:hypothetical protein
LIQSSGLETGILKYRPDLSIDIVIEQLYHGKKITEGDSLQKGSVIDLVLGKGLSNQRTSVPDLIGMSLEPAKNKILVASLNLGTYIYDNSIKKGDDTLHAFVYKQNPEFRNDASLQLGAAIYLWLTVDSAKLKNDSTMFFNFDTIPDAGSLNSPSN